MRSSSRFIRHVIACAVVALGLSLASSAFAGRLRFAPLAPPSAAGDAFAPSASVPVTPQLFRFQVTQKHVTMGVEAPYVRAPKPAPPIRIEQRALTVSPAVAAADAQVPKHNLRGPEALLLRQPRTVVGQTLP